MIADLASHTSTPDVTVVMAATRRRIGSRQSIPAQVATQAVAGAVAGYFRLYAPAAPWRFVGRDLCLNPEATDLIWADGTGAVIADTVLADTRPTDAQVAAAAANLRARAVAVHGPDVVRMRVLVPRAPELSCVIAHSKSA
ncbi:hypothetical protein [Longivirga aurantiaca]|uniref:Isochorismate synthase n=1 Tax=Longivirga aurantiaca TaxID=1837743 RepID=A0ABW1SZY0_9ACTN